MIDCISETNSPAIHFSCPRCLVLAFFAGRHHAQHIWPVYTCGKTHHQWTDIHNRYIHFSSAEYWGRVNHRDFTIFDDVDHQVTQEEAPLRCSTSPPTSGPPTTVILRGLSVNFFFAPRYSDNLENQVLELHILCCVWWRHEECQYQTFCRHGFQRYQPSDSIKISFIKLVAFLLSLYVHIVS